MGCVELCLRKLGSFERLYAVKRLHPHLRQDEHMRTMFLDEARVAGLLRQAHIVSVLDVGEDERGPFLVMDYVEGTSLSEFIRHHVETDEVVPAALCGSIVSQIARGLHAAHELMDAAGNHLALVHRDVSPQNVLVGRDGLVRVTDFGISKALGRSSHTSTGLLKGKLGYMSPEQLRFETVDRRSDLFALGIVFYELVTRTRLFRGTEANEVARRILDEPPPDIGDARPELPPAAVELCFRLLAKDPDDRPPTAAEVANTLDEAFALDEPVDLASHLEARFGGQLDARRAEIQRAVAELDQPPAEVETRPSLEALPPSSPEKPRRSRRALASVGIVAALGLGYLAMRPAPSSPARPSPARPSSAPSVPSPTPQASATVQLRIESRPPGAEIRIGDLLRGVTPMVVELPREVEAHVELDLEGYEPQRHTVTARADERLVVALSLQSPRPPSESPPVAAPSRRKRKRSRPRKPSKTQNPDPPTPRFRKFE